MGVCAWGEVGRGNDKSCASDGTFGGSVEPAVVGGWSWSCC